MKNSDYWKMRFRQLEAAQNQKGVDAYLEIEKQYKQAQREIEGKINTWYQRFATNNGISTAEARKMLSGKDLKEFKWDVQEYIKHGRENAKNQKWMKELENASARYHISRLEALKLQTQQSLELMFGNQLDGIDSVMKQIYLGSYYHSAYEIQKGFRIGWDIAGLNQSQIEKVISKPWAVDGKNFSERIWNNKEKLISELHTELTQNIMLGADPQKAIDNIAKKMNTSKYNAGRLVMTEEAYFSSAAQKDCFHDLGVEEYEIVATLDSHTSDICQSLDGKIFPMKDFEPGVTAPPFHVFCRSITVPHFNENFGKVGERAARDEKTGKTYYIPDDIAYQKWKEIFVDGGDKSGFDVLDDGSALHYKRLQKIPNSDIISSNNWQGINYSQSYTKKTAIDRLQSGYGIQFHDSKKYPINEGLLSDCVGWLDSFNSQYDGFMKRNPCKIPVIDNKAPSKMKNTVGYYSHYVNNSGVVELALDGQYHSDTAAFQKYVEQCVKKKWYPENATIHKTFVHEFGHHVSNSMRWITENPNWEHEFIQECIVDFKKVEPNYTWNTYVGMKDYVSEYGARNESELFAEAFAEYFGGENPREFAKIFGKKLDKLLKGVK